MNAFEQQVWAAVFAAEVARDRAVAEGFPVDRAARTADFAVRDLARYRKSQEADTPPVVSAEDAKQERAAARGAAEGNAQHQPRERRR